MLASGQLLMGLPGGCLCSNQHQAPTHSHVPVCSIKSLYCTPRRGPHTQRKTCWSGRRAWILAAAARQPVDCSVVRTASFCPSCQSKQKCYAEGGDGPADALQHLQSWQRSAWRGSNPARHLASCSVAGSLALGWSGGGGGGGILLGHSGGSGGGNGRHGTIAAATQASVVAASSEDVILLDVTGMRCGGCVSKVKSILEQEPPVVQVRWLDRVQCALGRMHSALGWTLRHDMTLRQCRQV